MLAHVTFLIPAFSVTLSVPVGMFMISFVSVLEVAYADSEEAASKHGLPADAPDNNMEDITKKQRQQIDDLLKSKGIRRGSYPNFAVSVKGKKVTIKFQIPPACEASKLIANIASNLGLKVEEHGGGSDISLSAWDSGVAWQLMLMRPEKPKETGGVQGELKDVNAHEGDLRILVFRSVITSSEKTISCTAFVYGTRVKHASIKT